MARLGSAFYNSDGASGLLNKDAIQCYHLIDLLIDDGSANKTDNLFLTDHIHTINYQSITQGSAQDYDPLGSLLGLSSTNESTAIKVGGLTLTLSSVDPSFINGIIETTELINKRVVVYRGFFETSYTAPSGSNSFLLYDGNIKDFSIEEGGDSAKVSITVASHWADFEKKTGRFTNTASQATTTQYNSTVKFTNDKGFDFSSAMVGDIQWGPRS